MPLETHHDSIWDRQEKPVPPLTLIIRNYLGDARDGDQPPDSAGDEEEAEIEPVEEAKPAAASGTLFERMSNIARGAAQAKVEDEPVPSFRREPLDIPRFLNRQNNQ